MSLPIITYLMLLYTVVAAVSERLKQADIDGAAVDVLLVHHGCKMR